MLAEVVAIFPALPPKACSSSSLPSPTRLEGMSTSCSLSVAILVESPRFKPFQLWGTYLVHE